MKKYFVIFTLVISLVSCSDDDDLNTSSTSIYALKVGNSWTYQFNDLNGVWNENMQTVSITGTQMINNEEFFIVERETTFDNNDPNSLVIEYLREDNQGYLRNSEGFVLAHPTDMSFRGQTPSNLGVNLVFQTFLDATALTQTVPVGTFNNVHQIGFVLYDAQGMQQQGTGESEFYYAPQVGLIKEKQSFTSSPTFVYEKVLVSYVVN